MRRQLQQEIAVCDPQRHNRFGPGDGSSVDEISFRDFFGFGLRADRGEHLPEQFVAVGQFVGQESAPTRRFRHEVVTDGVGRSENAEQPTPKRLVGADFGVDLGPLRPYRIVHPDQRPQRQVGVGCPDSDHSTSIDFSLLQPSAARSAAAELSSSPRRPALGTLARPYKVLTLKR